MNQKKRKLLACINGVKGAISLFLAVLMTPFLSIALLLVEVERYNSAVSLLDEAMGVSSVSTLANYDTYLQDRWGLLALSQDIDLNATYAEYLETNTTVMGNAINLSNTSATGIYALSDTDILKSQILEYSKLNVPTTLASELVSTVTSMADFLKKIRENINVLNIFSSVLTSGINLVDGGITLVDSTGKLEESSRRLDNLKTEYETKYVEFETEVNTLIGYLQRKKSLESQLSQLNSQLATLQIELQELQEAEEEQENTNIENTEQEEAEQEEAEQEEAEQEEAEQESEEVKEKRAEIAAIQTSISSVEGQIASVNSQIQYAISNATSAQSNYAEVLNTIADELQNFRELISTVQEAMNNIENNIISGAESITSLVATLDAKQADLEGKQKDLEALKKELEEWEDNGYDEDDTAYMAGLEYKIALEEEVAQLERDKSELETQVAIYKATENSLGEMTDELSTSFEAYSDATIGAVITSFTELRTKILVLNMSAITADSAAITRMEYKHIELAGYIDADEIDDYLDEQEQKMKNGSFSALLDGLATLYNSIMGVSIFFEDDLDACLDLNYFEEEFGGLPGGTDTTGDAIAMVTSLGAVISSAVELQNDLTGFKFLELLTDIKNLAQSLLDLVVAFGEFVWTILTNIAEALSGYDRLYLCTYCTYNLSCRTDFNTGTRKMTFTTMSGTKVEGDSFPEADVTFSIPVFGEISALITTIQTCMNNSGTDRTFSGAELEYILFGSTSEVANQLYVFCVLYVLRLLECIPLITGNAEVQALAASSTFGYPVIMGMYYILEPLVQVALLANGKNQALIPDKVYLSPTGLPGLITELVSFCKFTSEDEDNIKSKMITAFAGSQDNYDYNLKLYEYENSSEYKATKSFKFSYKDFCLVLMIITVREDRLLERLSNLIQMETLYYYNNQEVNYTFDLTKSYTYLCAEADADVTQMMPTLIDSSIFSVHRYQYRGY